MQLDTTESNDQCNYLDCFCIVGVCYCLVGCFLVAARATWFAVGLLYGSSPLCALFSARGMCMFRVRADRDQFIVRAVDGFIVKVQAECCVCNRTLTLQQAGAPLSVQKMSRMRVAELALASVMLQSDGGQPF